MLVRRHIYYDLEDTMDIVAGFETVRYLADECALIDYTDIEDIINAK